MTFASTLVPMSTESDGFIKLHTFLLNIFVKRTGFYPMIKVILISHHRHHPNIMFNIILKSYLGKFIRILINLIIW